jgi:YidC/Oxa1 family membrane protein insertase
MSAHMGFNEGAFDAFDTILCVGPHFVKEIRETEKVYGLKEKTLVEFGFPLMDELVKKGKEESQRKEKSKIKDILIAPSWQEDNILDSCIDTIIEKLYGENYRLIVRPHPEYVKRCSYQLNNLVEKYKDYDKDKLVFELDFSTNKSVYSADLLITDWSGISTEYCFATENPAIFINTKMKVNNPNWENLGITPMEITVRDIIGVSIDKEKVCDINEVAKELFENREKYSEKIRKCYETFTYNHGTAAEVGAKYVLKSIVKKRKK